MVAAQKKGLASAVSSGIMSQSQAQQIELRLASRMKDMVNGVRPSGGFRRGFPGGGGTGSFGGSSTA